MNADQIIESNPSLPEKETKLIHVLRVLDLKSLSFIVIFLVLFTFQSLCDPDYYWHLKTGQYILSNRSLPLSDIFSYTHYGQPWILHEWLFQVVLFGIFHWLGPFGSRLLSAALATSAIYIVYAATSRLFSRSTVAFCTSLAFLPCLAMGISPRPQLLTFLFFALFLHLTLGFKYLHRTRYLFTLPILMVVWVNAHAGYVIGIVLLALVTFCEWTMFLPGKERNHQQKLKLVKFTIITLTTICASCINPNFLSQWLYPFKVLHMEAAQTISEWRSPDFHLYYNKWYLLLILSFYMSCIYCRRPDLTEILVPTLFVIASLISRRHIPLATLTLIPFTALAIAQGLNTGLSSLTILTFLKRLYPRRINEGKQLGDAEYLFNWIILGLVVFTTVMYYPVYHARGPERNNSMIPVKATQFIIDEAIHGRMFNTYRYGGYLIYTLYPKQKVFIDGRVDMYGDAFLKEWRMIHDGGPGWEDAFAKHDIDYVVCDRNAPIRQLLLARGDFRLVYDDNDSSVLLADRPHFSRIIAKYSR